MASIFTTRESSLYSIALFPIQSTLQLVNLALLFIRDCGIHALYTLRVAIAVHPLSLHYALGPTISLVKQSKFESASIFSHQFVKMPFPMVMAAILISGIADGRWLESGYQSVPVGKFVLLRGIALMLLRCMLCLVLS